MTEYERQAKDFLASCNTIMEINFVCTETGLDWDKGVKHDKYHYIITTPKGTMSGDFWDSAFNTELRNMTLEQYFRKKYNRSAKDSTYSEQNKAKRELDFLKANAKPTEYSILACLEKYPVDGSIDDFMHEYGYEIRSTRDFTNLLNTYNAVIQEYNDLCRIFTSEQMERLREIW